jgi:DNA-binding FrmR family transcriptional regulator
MPQCKTCHPERRKERAPSELSDLVKRLNRIEGQIKGIRSMLEEERYCADILTQVAAAQQGMRSFGTELLKTHMKT